MTELVRGTQYSNQTRRVAGFGEACLEEPHGEHLQPQNQARAGGLPDQSCAATALASSCTCLSDALEPALMK
jgi:hypothetical protein